MPDHTYQAIHNEPANPRDQHRTIHGERDNLHLGIRMHSLVDTAQVQADGDPNRQSRQCHQIGLVTLNRRQASQRATHLDRQIRARAALMKHCVIYRRCNERERPPLILTTTHRGCSVAAHTRQQVPERRLQVNTRLVLGNEVRQRAVAGQSVSGNGMHKDKPEAVEAVRSTGLEIGLEAQVIATPETNDEWVISQRIP